MTEEIGLIVKVRVEPDRAALKSFQRQVEQSVRGDPFERFEYQVQKTNREVEKLTKNLKKLQPRDARGRFAKKIKDDEEGWGSLGPSIRNIRKRVTEEAQYNSELKKLKNIRKDRRAEGSLQFKPRVIDEDLHNEMKNRIMKIDKAAAKHHFLDAGLISTTDVDLRSEDWKKQEKQAWDDLWKAAKPTKKMNDKLNSRSPPDLPEKIFDDFSTKFINETNGRHFELYDTSNLTQKQKASNSAVKALGKIQSAFKTGMYLEEKTIRDEYKMDINKMLKFYTFDRIWSFDHDEKGTRETGEESSRRTWLKSIGAGRMSYILNMLPYARSSKQAKESKVWEDQVIPFGKNIKKDKKGLWEIPGARSTAGSENLYNIIQGKHDRLKNILYKRESKEDLVGAYDSTKNMISIGNITEEYWEDLEDFYEETGRKLPEVSEHVLDILNHELQHAAQASGMSTPELMKWKPINYLKRKIGSGLDPYEFDATLTEKDPLASYYSTWMDKNQKKKAWEWKNLKQDKFGMGKLPAPKVKPVYIPSNDMVDVLKKAQSSRLGPYMTPDEVDEKIAHTVQLQQWHSMGMPSMTGLTDFGKMGAKAAKAAKKSGVAGKTAAEITDMSDWYKTGMPNADVGPVNKFEPKEPKAPKAEKEDIPEDPEYDAARAWQKKSRRDSLVDKWYASQAQPWQQQKKPGMLAGAAQDMLSLILTPVDFIADMIGGMGGGGGGMGGGGGKGGAKAAGAAGGGVAAIIMMAAQLVMKVLEFGFKMLEKLLRMIVDSSPRLQATLKLLMRGLLLFLRPIGDLLGMALRPLARWLISLNRTAMREARKAGKPGTAEFQKAYQSAWFKAFNEGMVDNFMGPIFESVSLFVPALIEQVVPVLVEAIIVATPTIAYAFYVAFNQILRDFLTWLGGKIYEKVLWFAENLGLTMVLALTNSSPLFALGFATMFGTLITDIQTKLSTLGTDLYNGVITAIGTIGDIGAAIYTTITTAISTSIATMASIGASVFSTVTTAISSSIATMGDLGASVFTTISTTITDSISKMSDVGTMLSNSIVIAFTGVGDTMASILEKVMYNVFASIPDSLKNIKWTFLGQDFKPFASMPGMDYIDIVSTELKSTAMTTSATAAPTTVNLTWNQNAPIYGVSDLKREMTKMLDDYFKTRVMAR